MELKALSEVDLREAIGPINRAVTGHYLPLVRTASSLRERAAAGVLDLRLSRCAFVGRELVGTCLVERVDELAHIDAIGVDPLAQQRGVGHALLESACVAAEAGGVRRMTAEVPEGDAPLLATLSSAGFQPQRTLSRWTQSGALGAVHLPEAQTGEAIGPGAAVTHPFAREATVAEALARWRARPEAASAPFGMLPQVLERLSGRLRAFALERPEAADPVQAVAVLDKDKDRHQIHALCGEGDALRSLLAFLVARHGAQFIEALPDDSAGDDGATLAALRAVGLLRTALRKELSRSFAAT